MMEREFIAQKTKELQIKKYLENKLSNAGLSGIKLKKIPLGEKIIVYTSRPGLIVGSKGTNIKDLTNYLKKEFKLENPQIEISKLQNAFLDANAVAEKIASSLERFGPARFKGIGHKTMENVINAGALGVEIIISGKIPGARAKSWRFYQGYLKKCGNVSLTGVKRAKKVAALKSGIIGIKVSIMPPDVKLPDKIVILEEPTELIKETTKEKKPSKKKITKEAKSKHPTEHKTKKETVKEKTEVEKEKETLTKASVKKEKQKETKDIPSAEEIVKETKEKFTQETEKEKKEDIVNAKTLIEETKEKFKGEDKPKETKKITAEEIIENAKLLSENEKCLEKSKTPQKEESA